MTISRGDWRADCGVAAGWASDFDRFTCLAKDLSWSPLEVAGCGNAHSAFNGDGGYDRDTSGYAETACDAYSAGEFASPTTRAAGFSASGDLANWWEYIVDFDSAVSRARGG